MKFFLSFFMKFEIAIFFFFFVCSDSRKKIVSLEDLAPSPLDMSDDPRILYPVAMLPVVESGEPIEETELNARTIAICLDQLQNAII